MILMALSEEVHCIHHRSKEFPGGLLTVRRVHTEYGTARHRIPVRQDMINP